MSDERHPDPVDQLAEEYAERLRRGESPSIGEYVRKYPHLADQINEVLPVVLEIECHPRPPPGNRKAMEIPEQLGDYEVLELIGRGGMGDVYKARHRRMKRDVAIKILPQASLDDDSSVQRFHREVEASAKLIHPNIVTAFDAGEHQSVYYLVMEHVEGQNLAEILYAGRRLTVGQALQCALQAAQGLAYAHAHGVVHRDVKPANLMLDREGTVKILDMGLSRLQEHDLADPQATSDHQLTGSGQIMGTSDYISPEQAEDTHQADERSDVYSLGCTLYALLVGKPVFEASTPIKKLLAHREAPIPSLRVERADAPKVLEVLFRRLMAKKPEDRPQSMEEVIEELQKCAEGLADTSPLSQLADAEHVAVPPQDTATFAKAKTQTPSTQGMTGATRSNSLRRRCWVAAVLLLGAVVAAGLVVDAFRLFTSSPHNSDQERADDRIVSNDQVVLVRKFTGHTRPVHALTFSADGSRLFTGSFDGWLRVFDVKTGNLLQQFHTGSIGRIAVLNNDKSVIVTQTNGDVGLWDVSTGNRRREFVGHTGSVWGLAVSSDERLMLTGSYKGDETTRVWDLRSGKCLRHFKGACACVAISPDGRFGLRNEAGELITWELSSEKPGRRIGRLGLVPALAFSQDGKRILAGTTNSPEVRVINAQTGEVSERRYNTGGACWDIGHIPDGRHFVAGAMDNTLRVFNLQSGTEVLRLVTPKNCAYYLAVSTDGRHVACSGGMLPGNAQSHDDFDVRLWRLPEKLPEGPDTQIVREKDLKMNQRPVVYDRSPNDEIRLVHTFPQQPASIGLLRFSTDGTKLITGCFDGLLRVFDVPNGNTVIQQIPTGSPIAGGVVLKDGRRVVTGGWKGAVQLWSLETGRFLRAFPGHTNAVYGVAVSPDQQWLLTGSRDETIRLWNVETAQVKHEFKGKCDAVAFSPDGQSAMHATSEALVCWEVKSGKVKWRKDYRNVFRLAISRDGKWMLTGKHSGLVKLITVESGEEKRTIHLGGTARGVHFLPDGKHFILGSDDRTLRLFEIQTGDEVARVRGRNHYLGDVGVSPDGRYVATGHGAWFDSKGAHEDGDYAARLWRLADRFVVSGK